MLVRKILSWFSELVLQMFNLKPKWEMETCLTVGNYSPEILKKCSFTALKSVLVSKLVNDL